MGTHFDFSIEPGQGVGPVRFGMTKDEVSRLFTYVYRSFFKSRDDRYRSDQIEAVGLIVHYDSDGVVEYIEAIPRPPYADVSLLLYGADVTHSTIAGVLSIVSSHSNRPLKEPTGYSFPDLGLTTYNELLDSDQDVVESFGLERLKRS